MRERNHGPRGAFPEAEAVASKISEPTVLSSRAAFDPDLSNQLDGLQAAEDELVGAFRALRLAHRLAGAPTIASAAAGVAVGFGDVNCRRRLLEQRIGL